jgi:hypothetical protein
MAENVISPPPVRALTGPWMSRMSTLPARVTASMVALMPRTDTEP